MGVMTEEYTRTYTSFGGADIVASFNGNIIGSLQAITYSISREKAPVYTMGNAEPRSFTRGKRGIAGSLVFTVFDRDSLITMFKKQLSEKTNIGLQKFKANDSAYLAANGGRQYLSIDEWDQMMSDLASGSSTGDTFTGTTGSTLNDLVEKNSQINYADEIPPFDITITFANEYGQKAVLNIYGVELLNEGSGHSIDSVTTEKAYTYVARKIDHMKPVGEDEDAPISTSF